MKANGRGPPDAHDVHAFNQRSVEGIPDMIRTIGAMVAMVEARERAEQLVATLEAGPDADRRGARRREQPGSSERASVARGGAGIRVAASLPIYGPGERGVFRLCPGSCRPTFLRRPRRG